MAVITADSGSITADASLVSADGLDQSSSGLSVVNLVSEASIQPVQVTQIQSGLPFFLHEPYDVDSVSYRIRVRQPKFGDGYSQRYSEGINNVKQQWKLTWKLKSDAEIQQAIDFFDERAGANVFWWQPPGYTSPRKFVCKEWQRTYDHFTVAESLTATVEEWFG